MSLLGEYRLRLCALGPPALLAGYAPATLSFLRMNVMYVTQAKRDAGTLCIPKRS